MPTARNVPNGRLFPAFFRSPDILIPWVNPVTAGKKIAKITQKPGPSKGGCQFCARFVASQCMMPPQKKDIRAAVRMPMTTY